MFRPMVLRGAWVLLQCGLAVGTFQVVLSYCLDALYLAGGGR